MVVVAAGAGRQQACKVGALWAVRGSLLEAAKAWIGLHIPHPQEREMRRKQSPGRSPGSGRKPKGVLRH